MSWRDYISSGLLEQYVLGMTSPEENKQVREAAEQSAEIRKEIASIQEALETYIKAHSMEPPAHLKDKILSKISEKPKQESISRASETVGFSLSKLFAWLFFALLLVLGYLYFSVLDLNKTALEENKTLRADYQQLQDNCDSINQISNQTRQQFFALRHEATQTVRMSGTTLPHAPDAIANIYYNPSEKTAFLDVINLPAPPAGKQYQLWSIVATGPTSMGVFDIPNNNASLQTVPFILDSQAFAVTLEDVGGVESPTLEQMYVIGNVSG